VPGEWQIMEGITGEQPDDSRPGQLLAVMARPTLAKRPSAAIKLII
jgi:hypothetical protein